MEAAITEIGVFAAIFIAGTTARNEPFHWVPAYWFLLAFVSGLVVASFLLMGIHWPGIRRTTMAFVYKAALVTLMSANAAVLAYFLFWWAGAI